MYESEKSDSFLHSLPCIFSGIIKNFRSSHFSCINSPDKNLVNGLKMSTSLQLLLVVLLPAIHLIGVTEGNLRCYSCAPCNELELYAGDVTHFEQDCYLDRYCMKVSHKTKYLKKLLRARRDCSLFFSKFTLFEIIQNVILEFFNFGPFSPIFILFKKNLSGNNI